MKKYSKITYIVASFIIIPILLFFAIIIGIAFNSVILVVKLLLYFIIIAIVLKICIAIYHFFKIYIFKK